MLEVGAECCGCIMSTGPRHWKAYNECTQTPLGQGHCGASSSKCVNYSTLLNRELTYPANFSLALGPVANGGFLFKQPFKTEFQKADRGAPGQNRPASLIVAGFRAGKTSSRAHILRMTEKPKFHSKMIKNGRWTVVVTTGYGPESRVGDFATEEEAQRWISTKSKDWSPPTGDSK